MVMKFVLSWSINAFELLSAHVPREPTYSIDKKLVIGLGLREKKIEQSSNSIHESKVLKGLKSLIS